MTITINYSEVCDSIYASTALATLSPAARITLLHPDHADALRVVIRDCVAVLVAALPPKASASVAFTPDTAVITAADTGADPALAARAIAAQAASLTLLQIKIAASSDPAAVLRLAAVLPEITAGIGSLLDPAPRPATIRPWG